MDKDFVGNVLRSCLSMCCPRVKVLETSCSEIKRAVKGKITALYAFIDQDTVYYIGQSTDVLRRIGSEHCGARIGASEGVVRFLMYLLDKICNNPLVHETPNVVVREEIVSGIIKNFLNNLKMVLAICNGELGRKCLTKAEKCAKIQLKPKLNPTINS